MYNYEQKESFIRDYTNNLVTASGCVNLFNRVEKYEERWGDDVCTRSVSELQPMVDDIIGLRTTARCARLIVLREYARWCISNGIPGASDSIFRVNTAAVSKVKAQTVFNPAELQKHLDILFLPEDKESVDCIYRCYMWLAYCGIEEDDAFKIACENVDFDNMVINYQGKRFPIYKESVAAFKNAVNLKQFAYIHPLYFNVVMKDRASGNNLLRTTANNCNPQSFKTEISRTEKANEKLTGKRLSYSRVKLSGLFYRAYIQELLGDTIDFLAVAEEQMSGKEYKLDSGRNTRDAKKRQIARDYLDNYRRWKLAFVKI